MEEFLALPPSEILGWEQYFSIYGFSHIREDIRHAELLSMIANASGRFKNTSPRDFFPIYLRNERIITEKSREQQKADKEKFKSLARQMQKKTGVKIFKEGGK